jgi:FkbM family methyltransferase
MRKVINAISHPGETLDKLLQLRRNIKKVNRLELENDLKLKVRKTCFSTFFLKRYDSQNKVAEIAGYNVKFLTYDSLLFLFNEVFLNQEYCFTADKKNPFIIDCGSNIGMSVLYFKMIYPNSEILAFEPDKDAFGCLAENIKANGLHAVLPNQKALSNKEGSVDFYYDQDNPGSPHMSTLKERMPKQKQAVEAVRLSRYVDREVDFLKLDVEGVEQDILEELNREGKLRYIKQMAIEYHHHIVGNMDVFSQILSLLENAGFGYQIESRLDRPFARQQFQDIFIYAYRKN